MKKILLVAPSLRQGGIQKVCTYTAELLRPSFEVRIAVFDGADRFYETADVPVHDLALPSRNGRVGKLINIFRRGKSLRRLIRKEQIDIVYGFGPTANFALVAAGRCCTRWMGIRSFMDMRAPRQIRLFCKKADRVLCCSEALLRIVETEYNCDHAFVLPNPFDIQDIQKKAGADKPQLPWTDGRILVTMSREDEVKGFWHLIKAFSLVHASIPDAKLLFIGEGEFRPYRKLAEDLGVADAVYFAGMQKNPYPYVASGCMYVLTSYYEGFPNAMVEAMALGLPVVATDCQTGPAEILDNQYGILVPNMSPAPDWDASHITEEEKNLADAMTGLLQDSSQMKLYHEKSLERAAHYSAERYVQTIRTLADEV